MSDVFEAQGRGPNTFTSGRPLVVAGTTSPVVARLAQDMSATAALETAWRAMAADNDLPAIAGVWGVGGVISAANAQAAMAGLSVHSVAGVVPNDWTDSVLAGHNLAFEPEPEF
jgi:hypothetical protein